MHIHPDEAGEQEGALERQVEIHAEAAKRAIREYKKTILHETGSGGVRQTETRREVEQAVNQYMQLCRKLDELRTQMNSSGAR